MGKTENSNILKNKSNTNDLDDLDDFSLILNRSEKIDKIINIDNHVIKLDYTYTSGSNYSDEVLFYLTQTIDKVNQFKYNNSINNTNSNNNFQIILKPLTFMNIEKFLMKKKKEKPKEEDFIIINFLIKKILNIIVKTEEIQALITMIKIEIKFK